MKQLTILVFLITQCAFLNGQSFIFGPKFGPSIGSQKWDNFEKDPLFAFHGAVFIESYNPDEPTTSLHAQVGYHVRGSANRFSGTNGGFSQNFKFNNLALALGARKIFHQGEKFNSYYSFGLRVEYTLNTNLSEFESFNSLFLPNDQFVKKLQYGLNIGAGMDFPFSKFVTGFLELNVSPDVSLQYDQPRIENVINPWGGALITLGERRIRNVSVEISIGFRFLREVEYYD